MTGSLQQALPRWGDAPLVLTPLSGSLGIPIVFAVGRLPCCLERFIFFRAIVGGEYNTDGSISLSLALLRRLFKWVRFAFQMVNVSVSNITVNQKKKYKKIDL